MSSSTFNSKLSLKRAGLLVILAAALFLFFDRGLFFLLRETSFYFYQKSSLGKDYYGKTTFLKKNQFNTLILGSSRTKEGILPLHLFENLGLRAYNAGSPGRYPQFHYYFYLKFKQENGIPRIVIIGMDYFIFSKESNLNQLQIVKGETPPDIQRIDHKNITNPASQLLSKISLLFRSKKELDTFIMDIIDFTAMHVEKPNSRQIVPAGVSSYQGLFGRVPEESRVKPSQWETSPYSPFPGIEGNYLKMLLDELREDRVRVFLVGIPDYINIYATNIEHEAYAADIARLAQTYPRVIFINYNTPEHFSLSNPDFFVDGRYGERISHLSVFGAKNLNKKLCQDIKKYLR